MSRGVTTLLLLLGFLVGVKALGDGFQLLGSATLELIFSATANPFVSLFVGILATTVMQSSSVTTSMLVGLVASPESPLPLANAVPMIMGANIGTTVTATLVSLAHVGRDDEFERAFPIAICHDLFNYMTVLVLLPFELLTGYLQQTAVALGQLLEGTGGIDYESPFSYLIGAALEPIKQVIAFAFAASQLQGVALIVVGGGIIFATIILIVKIMQSVVRTKMERMVANVLGSNAVLAMLVGAAVTVMVQSSSITTSLLVPLGAAGVLRLEQAFPITIGANVGTTVTALFAALAGSGANRMFGLEIALVHLLFNLTGMILIYPLTVTRRIPLKSARYLTKLAVVSPRLTLLCVAGFFYGLPALLLFLDRVIG